MSKNLKLRFALKGGLDAAQEDSGLGYAGGLQIPFVDQREDELQPEDARDDVGLGCSPVLPGFGELFIGSGKTVGEKSDALGGSM